MCLVENIDHQKSTVNNPLIPIDHVESCECMHIVERETFLYLLQHRNQIKHFDAIWNPFFGNKRIIWFADHYLQTNDTQSHNDIFSILLKSIRGTDTTGWDELLRILRSIRSEDGFELTSTGRQAVTGVALAVYPYHLFHVATQLSESSSAIQWQCLQECCRRVNYERPSIPLTSATITRVKENMEKMCLTYAERSSPIMGEKDTLIFDCAILILAEIKRKYRESIGVRIIDALKNLLDNPLFEYARVTNLVHSNLDIQNIIELDKSFKYYTIP